MENLSAISPNTLSQSFIGSGDYDAPEFYEQEQGVYCMKKADIYALGSMAFYLMFGYYPEVSLCEMLYNADMDNNVR